MDTTSDINVNAGGSVIIFPDGTFATQPLASPIETQECGGASVGGNTVNITGNVGGPCGNCS